MKKSTTPKVSKLKELSEKINNHWNSLTDEQKKEFEGLYRNAFTSHAYSGINLKHMVLCNTTPGPMVPLSALYRREGKTTTWHYRMKKGASVLVGRRIEKEPKEGEPINKDEQRRGYFKWMGKVVPLHDLQTLDGKPVDVTMLDYEKKTLVDASPELLELAREEYAQRKLEQEDLELVAA